MVPEVPAHPSTKHRGADGARGSRTTKGLGCRWCPSLPHIEAPRCRWRPRLLHDQGLSLLMVFGAPAHPSTKVPMVPEAPAHPSTKLPLVSVAPAHPSHRGADTARGSCTSEAPRCRWCPRLPHDQGLRCRWWPRPPHDQGPILPMVPEAPARPRA
ncbi:hypothetical protein V6Z12_D08G097800 [Gossypium hirsutum]